MKHRHERARRAARQDYRIAGNFAEMAKEMADHVLDGTVDDAPNVCVGPCVWETDPTGRRLWYFIVGSAGAEGFRCDKFGGHDRELVDQMRAGLFGALMQRRPILLHDFDCEIEMARWCAAICPSDTTRRIAAAVEAEKTAATVH